MRRNAINVENQLNDIQKNLHQQYQNGQEKSNNQNQLEFKVENKSKGCKNTTVTVGDSIISGIDQQRNLSIKERIVKVRSFPGATINNMYDYIKSLLKKASDNVILHVGTNDASNSASIAILDKMLSSKVLLAKSYLSRKFVFET